VDDPAVSPWSRLRRFWRGRSSRDEASPCGLAFPPRVCRVAQVGDSSGDLPMPDSKQYAHRFRKGMMLPVLRGSGGAAREEPTAAWRGSNGRRSPSPNSAERASLGKPVGAWLVLGPSDNHRDRLTASITCHGPARPGGATSPCDETGPSRSQSGWRSRRPPQEHYGVTSVRVNDRRGTSHHGHSDAAPASKGHPASPARRHRNPRTEPPRCQRAAYRRRRSAPGTIGGATQSRLRYRQIRAAGGVWSDPKGQSSGPLH